jgi:hypothetical protein
MFSSASTVVAAASRRIVAPPASVRTFFSNTKRRTTSNDRERTSTPGRQFVKYTGIAFIGLSAFYLAKSALFSVNYLTHPNLKDETTPFLNKTDRMRAAAAGAARMHNSTTFDNYGDEENEKEFE